MRADLKVRDGRKSGTVKGCWQAWVMDSRAGELGQDEMRKMASS